MGINANLCHIRYIRYVFLRVLRSGYKKINVCEEDFSYLCDTMNGILILNCLIFYILNWFNFNCV